jgi:hypothetical protein
VPLTALCSTLQIIQLEGACSSSGRKVFTTASVSKAAFKDLADTAESGTYESVMNRDRDIEVGSLTFRPVADTAPNTKYSFGFVVTNPVVPQNSPGIEIRALGIPIQPMLLNKEMGDILTSPCEAVSLACHWVEGDAAPLKVHAPMFLQKDIAQDTPYPMEPNTLSVTLMTNIPLPAGSLITLSSLSGARTPTGEVVLSGDDRAKFDSGVGSSTSRAYWDSEYKRLTLRVVSGSVAAGVLTKFSFVLQNPNCFQPSPAVCVRASRISTTCLDCSLGQCVTLSRQAMERDYVTILDYGVKGNANHGNAAYYSPSAVVTYTTQPPQVGDAAPLLVYAPQWVVTNITQNNPYPGGYNVITATISTNATVWSFVLCRF